VANTRKADGYIPKPPRGANLPDVPSQRDIDHFNAFVLDGVIDSQGQIFNAISKNSLVYGKAKDVSPGYWKFLEGVHQFGSQYPTSDPRTWVPLVRAGLNHGSWGVQPALEADTIRLNGAGKNADAAGTPVDAATVASDTPDAEDPWSGGFLSDLGAFLHGPVESMQQGQNAIGDVTSNWTPVTATQGLREDVGRVLGGSQAYSMFKGTVRNFFAAAQMPQQAIVGWAANLQDDASKGDYKSYMLHLLAINPVFEAGFIGAENLTGTQFYREGGKEQSNWSQTDFGQTILDATGQGRAEQFGGPNDPMGVQANQGDGFFIRPTDEMGQLQRQARLNANTLVEAQVITPEDQKRLMRMAKFRSEDEALRWASEQGYEWNDIDKTWIRPAQGWTLGRGIAIASGMDPNSTAYKNFSGVIDFGAAFIDPTLAIPGGAVKSGVTALRRGGLILPKGMALGSTVFGPGTASLLKHSDIVERLKAGATVEQLQAKGATLQLVDRRGNVIATGGDVEGELAKARSFIKMDDPSGERALAALTQKGRRFRLVDSPTEQRLTPEEFTQGLTEGRISADQLKNGGFVATRRAWDWLTTGKGRHFVDGLVDETNPIMIWEKSNRNFTPKMAADLAEAGSVDEVRKLLAPRIGIDIRYQNDLAQFVTKIPSYDVGLRVFRATDIDRLKLAWKTHVPGQEFMPVLDVDTQDAAGILDNVMRWVRVATTDGEMDSRFQAAVARLMQVPDDLGRATHGSRYYALYGEKGDTVVVNSLGDVIRTSDDLKADLAQGKTIQDVLADMPPGARATQLGEDGVFKVIENILVEKGIPRHVARQSTTAWRDPDKVVKHYQTDGKGEDLMLAWQDDAASAPFLESDLLGKTILFPDVTVIRKHLSRVGHLTEKMRNSDSELAKKVGRAEPVVDDIATQAMLVWKQVNLMGLGLRYPVYTFRAAFDTLTTIALSGGMSPIRSPNDLFGLLVTSAMRKSMQGDSEQAIFRLRMARKMEQNPWVRMLWRDDLTHDLIGEGFDEAIVKLKNGDLDGNYALWKSLNASSGIRGSKGQDVFYQRKAQDYETYNRHTDGHWDQYSEGLVEQLFRMSMSPTAQRLARKGGDFEKTVEWFKTVKTDGRAAMSTSDPKVAEFLSTDEGVRQYLRQVNSELEKWTANDPDLLDAIAHGGNMRMRNKAGEIVKDANGKTVRKNILYSKHGSASWRPSNSVKRHLHSLHDNGAPLVDTVLTQPPATMMGKQVWDEWNRMLFASAGRWEDVYMREPFFRERYYAHVEDLADLMLPAERAKAAAVARRKGSPGVAKKLEAATGDGFFTRKEIHDVAAMRAHRDITDIAYDAANRREWAYALRLLSPFVQAAVNGMYRWSKAALQNPESSYRVLKGLDFMSGPDSAFINQWIGAGTPMGQPFLYEDPSTGERKIAIPLLGALASRLGLPADTSAMFSVNANMGFNMGFQNFENTALKFEDQGRGTGLSMFSQALWPGLGPVAIVPLSLMSDGTEQWAQDYVFPYGTGGNSWEQRASAALLPRALTRIADFLMPDDAERARRAGRMFSIAAQMAKEQGGYATMTVAEKEALWKRATSVNNAITAMEAFGSLAAPTRLSADILYKDPENTPDHMIYAKMMAPWFQKYLDANKQDYSKAEAMFVNDFGLETLLLLTPSGDSSDAAPPTFGAAAMRNEYPQGYDKYGPVLRYLLPAKDGSEFDLALYIQQIDAGQVRPFTFEERVGVADERLMSYIYDHNLKQIQNSPGSDLEKTWAQNNLWQQMVDLGLKNTVTGRTREEREFNIGLMQQAANDPQMADWMGGRRAQQYLASYLATRDQLQAQLVTKGSNDLAQATSSGWQERGALFALGESYALKDQNFAMIWWRALRSEVANDEEG
jgi:hypothetical protein